MWHPTRSQTLRLAGLGALVLAGATGVVAYQRFAGRGGGDQPTAEDVWFAEVTDAVGVDFVHDVGDLARWDLPQIDGSGVAVFDADGDGRLDLYFLTLGGRNAPATNRLYRNALDGTFRDVTAGSGLGIAGDNTGVIVGDVDNDGRPDVLVTQVGGCRLFRNAGNGTFADVTAEAGLRNPLWATSANFFDYDRDGWLDLVVVNYLEHDPTYPCYNATGQRTYCGPRSFPGTVSKLFHNLGGAGPGVRFEDVTVKAGLATPGPGLAAYCADFDGDEWPDIFIANDAKPNHLWINQRNGTFKEEALFRGLAVDGVGMAQAGMGIAVGDADGDGLFDVYITHLNIERNVLWQQTPRGRFVDRTARSGLADSEWRGTGWGTLMRDFDQDGWPDIAVVNGAVTRGTPTPNPALGPHFQEFSERNQVFRNEGEGKFRDVSGLHPAFCGTPRVTRGLAAGDLDGDGALDLVVTTVADRARVYRNVARGRGHWLLVRAIDPRLRRDAYGAEVVVTAGGRRQPKVVNPGDSYQCSSDPRVHFGLGEAARFDAVRVRWPDGLAEDFPGGEADRVVVLRRGEGTTSPPPGGR